MRLKPLLALLLLLPFAAAAAETEYFTATTTGELTIDAQGRVAAVDIDHRQLGDAAMEALAARVRSWQFEPVLEAGQPVAVRGHMELSLLAINVPGQPGMDLAIRKVTFLDPPGTPPAPGTPVAIGRLAPPRYPAAAVNAGVGALVMLNVRLSADGSVADIAADRVLLYGDGNDDRNALDAHVRRFVAAATSAAQKWRFSGGSDQLVVVPVKFNPPGFTNDRWSRTRVFALARPAWLTDALAVRAAPQLDLSGRVVDARLQLRTPLEDTLPETEGG